MQSWIEKLSAESRVPSKVPSPSKWGYFTDRVCKTRILYKGQSCKLNFEGKLFSRYYRLYLEKPLVLEVTAKVTALPIAVGVSSIPSRRSRYHGSL